jgi:adenylate cyclase
MMPDMDGYEVLRRIRQHTPTANVPVIFLTALASQQDERLGMDLGAVDYLTKPVDPELVIQRVEAHVRATTHARRIEELSEKLSRHLLPQSWERLFHGAELEAIRFEQKHQTLLYAETGNVGGLSERNTDSLAAEVDWLATLHGGIVDRFVDGAAVVCFDEPSACVRMAMDLQRNANDLHLRMGIHTGVCEIATFRTGGEPMSTLIGHEAGMAAKVASTATTGSIAVSPETYALVKDDIRTDTSGCLLMEEFHDSGLAQVCLTPTPIKGEHTLSTFAGLGL